MSEPGLSRDHTERMLSAMGAELRTETTATGSVVHMIPQGATLSSFELSVPGDLSSAAFLIALAALGGAGDELRLESVGLNPGRTAFLSALERMGAELDWSVTETRMGEPVGDVTVRPSQLTGIDVEPSSVPALIDEIPILMCLGARARGTTTIRGASELRVKETDRIAALARNLAGLAVEVREYEDGLAVSGTDAPLAGVVSSHGDHRIAMAFGVLDQLPDNEIQIDDRACADVSYPGFWDDLASLSTKTPRS